MARLMPATSCATLGKSRASMDRHASSTSWRHGHAQHEQPELVTWICLPGRSTSAPLRQTPLSPQHLRLPFFGAMIAIDNVTSTGAAENQFRPPSTVGTARITYLMVLESFVSIV